MTRTVAVIVGSLRKDALTRKLAHGLAALAPPSLKFDFVNIDMPLYNQDLETDNPPAAWTAFREKVKAADAVLFVTPEYNRSVSAPTKNAVDVGSRPWGKNIFDKKPAAVVSGSVGALGGFGANHHLRQSVTVLNAVVMPSPETFVHMHDKFFDAEGKIADERQRPYLTKVMETFAAWIEQQLK